MMRLGLRAALGLLLALRRSAGGPLRLLQRISR